MPDHLINYFNGRLDSTVITPYTATLKLFISFILGAVIEAERQFRRRDAGMRTFTLICMGSTAAMLISI
ncbi:MAG: MgtC/SapB family protein [Massilibacteroides sp.]|nr:MgtC/SapB family protein [Massilibacteroides sp.]MDD3063139.1 MgtC/SapB family protein [Massilibacteroides sp.]MDD4116012.1 MgtC/SapB family protein [Massilibacteroides sp.]MDD4661602.1 MgtC/SapB family protein [Massilibacteroides sp.]